MPYTKEFIANKLVTNNEWLIKGLLAIYNKQTDQEQAAGCTREDNGVGFNGADSVILSSFAEQIKRWQALPLNQRRFGIPLSPKQLAIAKKKMPKYARQLAEIANANRPETSNATTAPQHQVNQPVDDDDPDA